MTERNYYTGDLRQYPTSHRTLQNKQYVFGDLHGNVLYLINCLLQEGIFQTTPAHYAQLVAFLDQLERLPGFRMIDKKLVLEDNTPSKEAMVLLLRQFTTLLEHLIPVEPWPENFALRFLGDTLGDRGQNDIFMLLMYQKLQHHDIDYEIAFSNHDEGVVRNFCNSQNGFGTTSKPGKMSLVTRTHPAFLDHLQISMHRMIAWLQKDPDLIDKVNHLLETVYLPHLRLVCYDIDAQDKTFYIGTHGVMSLKQLFRLVYDLKEVALAKLKRDPTTSSPSVHRLARIHLDLNDPLTHIKEIADLTNLFDTINAFFVDPLNRDIVAQILNRHVESFFPSRDAESAEKIYAQTDSLYNLIWADCKLPRREEEHLKEKNGLFFRYEHGHIAETKLVDRKETLDAKRGYLSDTFQSYTKSSHTDYNTVNSYNHSRPYNSLNSYTALRHSPKKTAVVR